LVPLSEREIFSALSSSMVFKERSEEIDGEKYGQTPDFPATHAAVATVAPFPAWRGSQG
jgi:hypothetical protein